MYKGLIVRVHGARVYGDMVKDVTVQNAKELTITDDKWKKWKFYWFLQVLSTTSIGIFCGDLMSLTITLCDVVAESHEDNSGRTCLFCSSTGRRCPCCRWRRWGCRHPGDCWVGWRRTREPWWTPRPRYRRRAMWSPSATRSAGEGSL